MPKNVCADPRADNADRADYSDPRADAKANFESREKTHKNADADPRGCQPWFSRAPLLEAFMNGKIGKIKYFICEFNL